MNTLCNARFALTLILVMAFFSGFSQKAQHVPGEVLIQFSPGITAEAWLKRSPTIQNAGFYVKTGKRISAPLNIYSVQFDHQQIDEDLFLELVRQSPYVQIAQFNHYVELRSTIPNDPQYGQQWQYDNTGQGGGTPGADIDMDLAWDFTTGGLTASGDTIVVCVIDDGISATHPDIAPNLWINHAEIPNNGIDDDNNGFVDDYRGWDTGSGTDEVYDGGGHGTPVAGIVGAKGDNNEGVAGVNWNVKLMIVQGGTGVESEVLEAYSYPLVMRQKYNATNGQEGAFVVSTNASWGVNFGQASSAPLWCAFYDTLGAYGILNAGATANAALDVDVDGDLPTSCPSDYLISVTNMNRNDVKVNQAAWGLTHVDLGAFGEGTWTTAAVGYGGFGGTSGATPHVAGTIALLYSAPCPALISLAKSNPAAAALLVKQAILDGVDPNTSLNNITVTGGRLNVHNSMLLLLQNCGPCPAPFIQAETELTDVQARLNWTVNDSALTTDLQWRVLGDTVWNAVNGLDSTYLLTGLLPCTEYEYQLISNCPNDTSD
ncbi:MAG: S8 family serine peptidase, partial [Bacteroidota bacterium]